MNVFNFQIKKETNLIDLKDTKNMRAWLPITTPSIPRMARSKRKVPVAARPPATGVVRRRVACIAIALILIKMIPKI